jgi:hypothetical protein
MFIRTYTLTSFHKKTWSTEHVIFSQHILKDQHPKEHLFFVLHGDCRDPFHDELRADAHNT